MKTPDEIKKGLECCISDTYGCNEKCPYFNSLSNGVDCAVKMHADALACIQQLETERHQLLTKCERLERERDALLESTTRQVSKALCGKGNATMEELLRAADQLKRDRDSLMYWANGRCDTCAFVDDCAKHDPDPDGPGLWWHDDCEDWEWRGVKEE